MFAKSIGSSRLWIEKPQNEVGKTIEAIRIIPSNKCKDVSLETMREKNRLISQDDSNATKDTIQKNPRKRIVMFSGM